MDYLDKNGLLRGKVKSQERDYNTLLFTPLYVILIEKANKGIDHAMIDKFFFQVRKDRRENLHISHDNATGICCMEKFLNLPSSIPIFSLSRLHPRDIIFYGYAKYPLVFWFFLWIPMIAMIVTCVQNTKVRNGKVILKTDGKILAWLRFTTFDLKITKYICTSIIKHNKNFKSFYNCFALYFGETHPITKVFKRV